MPSTGMPGLLLYVLLVIVGLALVGYTLVRVAGGGITPSRPRSRDRGRSDAVNILEQRYARGELDTEEYHQRRRALEEER